ncbi:effector-associated constant component EACC1 [Streptomyces sp. NPDC000229]|uniref:effector-associated constant component EACC1 n=1 Tax=Streptomyces sp. NPDC000229 TaxID=3154247 RepID=UPI00332BB210
MSTIHTGPADAGHRITVVDEDPLRARRDARELLAALSEADRTAALDAPRPRTGDGSAKGGPVADVIGLVFSGGSLVAAAVQVWLARVPQRTIVVTRADGATLRVSGKQARADDGLIDRFLAGDPAPDGTEGDGEAGPDAE